MYVRSILFEMSVTVWPWQSRSILRDTQILGTFRPLQTRSGIGMLLQQQSGATTKLFLVCFRWCVIFPLLNMINPCSLHHFGNDLFLFFRLKQMKAVVANQNGHGVLTKVGLSSGFYLFWKDRTLFFQILRRPKDWLLATWSGAHGTYESLPSLCAKLQAAFWSIREVPADCQQTARQSALERHMGICQKVFQEKRKVFNAVRKPVLKWELDLAEYLYILVPWINQGSQMGQSPFFFINKLHKYLFWSVGFVQRSNLDHVKLGPRQTWTTFAFT